MNGQTPAQILREGWSRTEVEATVEAGCLSDYDRETLGETLGETITPDAEAAIVAELAEFLAAVG